MANIQHKDEEKRKGPDLFIIWIKVARIVVWIILGVLILLTDTASPQNATFFDYFFDVTVRSFWDKSLLFTSFIVAIILFIFSFISILINMTRLKRSTDRFYVSLVITLIISTIDIIFCISMIVN